MRMQMQMRSQIRKSLVSLLVAGLAGCTGAMSAGSGSGGTAGPSGSGGNSGTGTGNTTGSGGNSGTGNSGTGNSTGSGGATGTGGAVSTVCAPGIPQSSQVPRMTRLQYATVVKDLLGLTTLTSAGSLPPSELLAPDSTGSLTDIAWNGYLTAAEKIAAEVMANATNKTKFISCDPTQGTCLTDTIKSFGRKAFRRPLTDAEVTAFSVFNTLTPKGTAADVSEALLYAFLASPSFIMLPELAQDKDAASGALKLTNFEIATRLSFLFWNSVPDDILSTAADKGELQTSAQILAQAQRLLQSPKAAAVASTFHRYYAAIEPGSHWVSNTEHNAAKFPAFTAASYTDAIAEMDSFFQDVVSSGGTFKDMFVSPSAFVTKSTAALYGLDPATYTTTPKKVALDAAKRPGFLTRVGFLSTFSHADTSSPILRGAFISGRVLGIPTGTPDPQFLGATPPAGNYKTNREATEALTGVAPCNSCHTTKVNPPGFVLERYNAVGAWQDTDALTGPINSTADVMLATGTTKTISTPADLMNEIAMLPSAQRIYVQQWVAYATGRGPNANDACIVDKIAPNLAGTAYPISKMMADYTQADSFHLRVVGN